jgi:hypothetical protein
VKKKMQILQCSNDQTQGCPGLDSRGRLPMSGPQRPLVAAALSQGGRGHLWLWTVTLGLQGCF